MTEREVPANSGTSVPPYQSVDGYRHLHMVVQFSQDTHDEPPVDVGIVFAFSSSGEMSSRCYVNLDENMTDPPSCNFIQVSGRNCWHGNPPAISSYTVRCPVMGPFAQAFVYNLAPVKRTVSVWGYLVA